MADEQKQPENDAQPENTDTTDAQDAQKPEMVEPAADEPVGESERDIAENVPDAPAGDPSDVAATTHPDEDAEGDDLPDPENPLEESVSEVIDDTEAIAEESEAVQAYDETVEEVMEGMSDVAEGDAVSMTDEHHQSDTVTLPVLGTFDVYGGIYTVVFVALAVLTLIEVITAEAFPAGAVQIIALMLAAIAKSVLVVMFYMHLRTDNRIFWLVLALPSIVVLISVIYLMAVPVGSGLGYS